MFCLVFYEQRAESEGCIHPISRVDIEAPGKRLYYLCVDQMVRDLYEEVKQVQQRIESNASEKTISL